MRYAILALLLALPATASDWEQTFQDDAFGQPTDVVALVADAEPSRPELGKCHVRFIVKGRKRDLQLRCSDHIDLDFYAKPTPGLARYNGAASVGGKTVRLEWYRCEAVTPCLTTGYASSGYAAKVLLRSLRRHTEDDSWTLLVPIREKGNTTFTVPGGLVAAFDAIK